MQQAEQRERDLYILEELCESGELSLEPIDDDEDHTEAGAFGDMLTRLIRGEWQTLTTRQRAWVLGVAERLNICPVPAHLRAPVPLGNPVELAPVLRNLPKFPPGRRPA